MYWCECSEISVSLILHIYPCYRGDLAYFDGLSEPIIAVELVHPKPGIFQPHIQYLLCLATTVEIVLLGVSFSGSNSSFEEMHLLPEPLFAVPTDGIHIITMSGTLDGRIFMGAKDGCVYEFFYQVLDNGYRSCISNEEIIYFLIVYRLRKASSVVNVAR